MSLNAWVSDQLYSILGYSESNTEQYIISLATANVSQNDTLPKFLEKLKNANIPINEQTRKFASELISRIPSKNIPKTISQEKQNQKDAISLLKKNKAYEIIESDPKKKRKNIRTKEDDAPPEKKPKDEIPAIQQESERSELERLQDQKEKEEYDHRLKEKMTKEKHHHEHGHMDKTHHEQMIRKEILTKYQTDSDKKNVLSKLRNQSRENYLDDREKIQLEILETEIRDTKSIFASDELTEREKLRLAAKEEALRIRQQDRNKMTQEAEFFIGQDELQRDKAQLLKRKIVEGLTNENQEWEVSQIDPSQVGLARSENNQRDGKQYDLIMDEEIEFIAQDILEGKKEGDETIAILDAKATMQQVRESLPIFQLKSQLLQAIQENQVLILVGETGSGKSTQVVQYLNEAGYCLNKKKIGCTQPRRVAAMSLATRVAEEMECKLGKEVGYSIRFEDCSSDKTIIKFMTDGMMLREFLLEPDMASYSVVIIDEAHERSLHTDILFGLVKDVARFRKDIKIIISSATLEAKKFSEYFDDAPVFYVPGRRYPVDILYTKAPESNYLEAAVVTALQIHLTQPQGDILIFLTGQEDIETAEEMLLQRTKGLGSRIKELRIAPVYSTLPSEMQVKIFEKTPKGARKIVLATNIAETSLTIPDIVYVIDCGFCKQTSYNPRSGMESLVVVPISKAAANQRAGRSGRTAPGKCFRLFTKWSYQHELEENQVPEIQRVNLSSVVLMLKSLGINDLIHFDFMDPPPVETLMASLEHLYALGALNDKGELTKLGRRMAELPLDPMLSKMLLASEKYNCSEEIVTICAMLSVNNSIFYRPKEKAVHADNARKNLCLAGGDHLTLMNVYNEWAGSDFSTNWCFQNYIQAKSMKRARDVRDQLLGLMERVEVDLQSNPEDTVQIRKAISAGFFYHSATLQRNGSYKTHHKSETVYIHPSSSLFENPPKWVVYFQLAFTTKEFMRQVIEVDPKWLVEIAPHIYRGEDIEVKKVPNAKKKGLSELKH
jgi:pre-mRNA-splicing factor ATP-dependent RNA helicase DHX16